MNDLISIILPVCNVERYLRECLDSLVQQTYKNIEILIINDGSTDASGAICDEYALKDSRIRLFHLSNGGLSYARNVGIENAKGKYLTFVDSDDYVSVDYIEILYSSLIESDADMSIAFPYEFVEETGEYRIYYLDKLESKLLTANDIIELTNIDDGESFVPGSTYMTACWKLFNKELFEGIRFPIGMLYEDAATIHKAYIKSKKIIQIPKAIYCYRIRNSSLSHSKPTLLNVQSILYYCRVRTDDLFHAGIDPRLDFPFQKKEMNWCKRLLEQYGLQQTIEYLDVLNRLDAIQKLSK